MIRKRALDPFQKKWLGRRRQTEAKTQMSQGRRKTKDDTNKTREDREKEFKSIHTQVRTL